jgi:hypothetical protein
MAIIEELIRTHSDGSISFGNYQLATKSKAENFEHNGDLYKVKTYKEITKLEKNGMFVYESVPGTTVLNLTAADSGMEFQVDGAEDAQITLGLEDETEYQVTIDTTDAGKMKTNLSGKLSMSVELNSGTPVKVAVKKV